MEKKNKKTSLTSQAEEAETEMEKERAVQLSNIGESGGVVTRSGGITIHCMTVAGQIEGHTACPPQSKATKYEHIIPQLVEVEESADIDGLLIVLNTVGGDVEAGLAMAEMIAGMTKPTVSLVLGGGHSIGIPLAVSAKKSFIVKSATMTLHPVRFNGLVIGVPQQFSYFKKMQERILEFITDHSHADGEALSALMMSTDEMTTDVGSIIDGKQAVDIGLIDRVGSLSDALSELHKMAEQYRKKSNSRKSKKAE
ncbi:MAG: ATP-dependent Clp protease proteolytic subunit [Clostridia bacterium]|nr:ATP-dependent Clp protease proteolytic subunit [Clostridia bacterium]